MAHSFVLVAELMTVLIMILAVGDAVADGNETFCQFQILRIAGLTIHLGSTHVVRGTDSIAREFGSVVGEEVIQKVGSLLSAFEEGCLARGALVDDAGGHEVTKVVGLEIQA